jgi:feruloyl esterase
MRAESFHQLTIVLPALAALALAPAVRAESPAGQHRAGGAADCRAAVRIALPGAQITATNMVAPHDTLRATGQKAYCQVEATLDAETHLIALLPDDWNGRFLMGGAGGYGGAVHNQFESTVHQGYATVGTDGGHTAFPGTAAWALHNDRGIEEWGHRAVHRTAEVTKALIAAYYGRPPERSYFIGCSNGGREALMEAQRYPADFDGIVAIAPIFNPLEWATAAIRTVQAQYPSGSHDAPVLTPAVLRLLAANVTAACDTIDGVRDGILENPEACTFKLASLPACPRDMMADGCVTRAQRAALTRITTPLAAGTIRYPGWPWGDEADPAGWETWITGPIADVMGLTTRNAPTLQGIAAIEFFKYFVYGDSAWSYVGYDLARAGRDGATVSAIVSATNPDLSAFRARGGKLLLAHGWSDPGLSARSTIGYFTAVQQRTPRASSFTRLFLMPGVLHCEGGSGCDDVDYADVIRRWVEQDEAPSRIIARKRQGTQVVRTHPLCAFPMTARYNGTGHPDDAAAFTCR